jgi:hypothetical protein
VWRLEVEYANLLTLNSEYKSGRIQVMEQPTKGSSKARKIAALILVIVVAVVGSFAALTYPREIVSFSVSFTVGAENEQEDFEVAFLHSQVQVEVGVTSGSTLWSARILRNDEEVWSHATAQGDQTRYTSEWISLSPGQYSFTFATIGFGSLDADVSVTSKGGFW